MDETTGVLDIIVTIFFILGALTYVASSSMFNRLSQVYASSDWVKYLKTANRYLFMVLSFLPGLYYAFKYQHFILYVYLVIHFATTLYFFYKRFKEFELEPFAIGVGMSVVLYFIGPFIRGFFGIFGSGWFVTSLAGLVESCVDLGLAVAFLLDLPRKHLPANMLFGLKIVKYFMCFLSWQTWFILMVFATWTNIGAGALSFMETYNAIEIEKPSRPSRPPAPLPNSEKKAKD
ncbi:unnamed protein product [Orchesella dallaii]|uniref:Uncharacterized protein n=1 Tax=Orchesella dallaii TaxID=48710 RepID=A0ABP1Q678_9HEXA